MKPREQRKGWFMPGLDSFTRAYIEAALFSTNDNADDSGGEPLDKNYSEADIADETMHLIMEDCENFQKRFGRLIEDDDPKGRGDRWELAGHDFWLTREGHGAGFWDGGWPKHGDELTKAAKSYGNFELYVGDDGRIYGPPPDWYRKHHPLREVTARDYEAVDPRGRRIAGPFKDYGAAKQHADKSGGYVKWLNEEVDRASAPRVKPRPSRRRQKPR